MNATRDGSLDTGDWAVTDLESTGGGGAVAGRAREARKSFRFIQQARGEAGVEIPQNLLKLQLSLAEKPITAPSSAITPNTERLKAQHAICDEVRHYCIHLLAHESELFAEQNKVRSKAAEHKMSLEASVAQARVLKGKLLRHKAASDAARRVCR